MGYTLLDRRNPNGDHFYPSRNGSALAVVVHVTAGLEDLDGVDDHSAENTAAYASNTDRDVSWHSGSDTDSWVDLLPGNHTAWHVINYNSRTYGHEISKTHTDWSVMPDEWVTKTLTVAAHGANGHGGLRAIADQLGIPLRKATRAELDHAIRTGGAPVGFISHAELQPADRTDPGMVRGTDTFPWNRFIALLQGAEEDTLSWDTPLTTPDGKSKWPASTFETYTNKYAGELHDLFFRKHKAPNGKEYTLPEYIVWGNYYAAQADAKVAALTAAFTAFAAAQGSDITEDKLREIVDNAVAKHIQITGTVEITAKPQQMQDVDAGGAQ